MQSVTFVLLKEINGLLLLLNVDKMVKLNGIELNVLEVALDHMEEHLNDLQVGSIDAPLIQDRLDAVKTLKTKIKLL